MRGRFSRIFVLLALAGMAGGPTPAWANREPASVTDHRPASAADLLTVYLAPDSKGGSDQNTGLSPSSPVLTLARAQQVLVAQQPAGDVEIRIDQGTYVEAQTTWNFYVPGHAISFMPGNYVIGQGRPPGGDPVFSDTGSGTAHTAGWWLQAQEPASGPLHDGGTTALRFYYLYVQDYTNGLSLDGQAGHAWHDNQSPPMYIKPSAGLNGNTVFGMTFANIGDKFGPGQTGYGAILLTDSSANNISNNTYDHIENAGADAGLIHGVYVTHFSSYNTINANKFTTITSNAVKVTDRSNVDVIDSNRFNATGGQSAYRDNFCDEACALANPTARQCASYNNRFFYNTVGTVLGRTTKQSAWSLYPPGLNYTGGTGCSIPAGQQRLRTGGNS